MTLLDAVLAVSLGINLGAVGLFVLFWMLALISDGIERIYHHFVPPPGPHCDIDPRCHPAFMWGNDGNGHIGAVTLNMEGR
ncbi:MAG: hypothetical protein ACM3SS_01540 [Rhodospirillaceae bacterium]